MEASNQVSVAYYITNISEHLQFHDLRNGLEVCGILSDVYVFKNHNARGQIFGFAKFIKVRDVEKLKKSY